MRITQKNGNNPYLSVCMLLLCITPYISFPLCTYTTSICIVHIYIYIYTHFTSTINPLINDYVSGRVDEVKKKKSVQVQTYVVRRI